MLKKHKQSKLLFNRYSANAKSTVFAAIFAAIGTIVIVRSLAATPYVSIEPESGVRTGGVAIVNDSTASGGRLVSFGVAANNPSGQAMPVGDLLGWKQIFTEDFTVDAPLGSWADSNGSGVMSSAYSTKWAAYGDGWPDTAASNSGDPTEYRPSKVVSVNNGVLNKYLHTENNKQMAAALVPKIGNQLYGRYTARFKSDPVKGYKVAWLLWPGSEVWPRDGELDFPEGALNGNIEGYMHRQGATTGSDQDAFSTGQPFTSWHTYTIEWSPNKVQYILDGTVIGTSTNRVPNTPMHWVLQTESCMFDCWDFSSSGNLQVDWVAAYSYSP